LDFIYHLSKEVSDDVIDYRHNDLQAAIAGVVVTKRKQFTIVVSPTGSGKTWIQGLVAKYYCTLG
jgi:superfamily II DNA or RNA helicase